MLKLLRSVSVRSRRREIFQAELAISPRLAEYSSTPEYDKRNYAKNISEYNTVLGSLIGQRRNFLLRDVYDDMLLDGVQPVRDTFHSLIVGTMKGSRLQDAFYFRDEMKAMGLFPDVSLYNFLISTCGKCKQADAALNLLEEMKVNGVKPNGQTFICLLNACAASGLTDRVYAIVRDMTSAGLGLNKFCYAGLISAHRNKIPLTDDINSKIIELVNQSKGWSSVEGYTDVAENVMMGVSEEELYNIPTAEFAHRRGFVNSQLTVYHVACNTCADLRSMETFDKILEILKQDGRSPDLYIVMQSIRCYARSGDVDRSVQTLEDHLSSRPAIADFYVALAEAAMEGYSEKGMKVAQETLEKMNGKGFFLNAKMGNDLLLAASGEKTGGYTTANYVWDLMQSRKVPVNFAACDAYYNGLKERDIPADDPRLLLVKRSWENLRARFGSIRP
ncbi:pentatricopeptide repeat (PPR) superfamily protein isoform X2 [Wolffia australiana]